jgi:cation diffusion facilitator family transporter
MYFPFVGIFYTQPRNPSKNHRHVRKELAVTDALDSSRADQAGAWFAMRLSLAFGVLMLAGKTTAYFLTGSSAILADAAESVVHVVAVAFAAFSLRLSDKPADPSFLYGYEKISFFSAGFEGAMIALAAIVIIVTAVREWLAGLALQNLGIGTLLILAAALLNAFLGSYLLKTGRRVHSIILEANGKHVLADSWTSFGVLAGLMLVLVTRWVPFDPLVAIAVALNILWSGGHLIWRSVQGLLDYSDPKVGHEIRESLDAICKQVGVVYHGVRFRTTGHRQLIEVHLLFPRNTPLGEAHKLATAVEEELPKKLSLPAEVITHLESLEDHEQVHSSGHYTGRPK